jgi:hypothetical protein
MAKNALGQAFAAAAISICILLSWPIPLLVRSLAYFDPTSVSHSLIKLAMESQLSWLFWCIQFLLTSITGFLLLEHVRIRLLVSVLLSAVAVQFTTYWCLIAPMQVTVDSLGTRDLLLQSLYLMESVGLALTWLVRLVGSIGEVDESD